MGAVDSLSYKSWQIGLGLTIVFQQGHFKTCICLDLVVH